MCLAIPARVIEITDEPRRLAAVDVGGVRRTVNIGLLDGEPEPISPGHWVLVHVGFAMSRVDEEEARATLEVLQRMGEQYEDELDELRGSRIE